MTTSKNVTVDDNPFAPQEQVFTNFGEVILYRYFDGVKVAGTPPAPYDPLNPDHRGKRQQRYFESQFFAQGSQFTPYMNYWTSMSEEWKIFYASLCDVLGSKSPREFLENAIAKQEPFYAQWERVKARSYKQDGETKYIWSNKITALYATRDAMLAAYDEHRGIADDNPDDIPGFAPAKPVIDDSKMTVQQALPFIVNKARQVAVSENGGKPTIDLTQLKAALTTLELGYIDVQETAVVDALVGAGLDVLPF